MNPLVTVFTAVYNGQRHLSKAIESVLNQTYKNIQYLIIDDCSTDSTPDIIQSYKDSRIEYVRRNQNKGKPYHEDMIHLMRGEFVTAVAHDDRFYPDRIENLMDLFNQDLSLVAVYDKGELIDENEKVINDPEFMEHKRVVQNPARNQEEAFIFSFAGNALTANPLYKMQTFIDISEGGTLSNKKYRDSCFDAYIGYVFFGTQNVGVVDKIQYQFMVRRDALSSNENRLEKTLPKWFELMSEVRIETSVEDIFPRIYDCDDQEEEDRMRIEAHLYLAKLMARNDGYHHNMSVIEHDLEMALSYDPFASNTWKELSKIRARMAYLYMESARHSMHIAWSLSPHDVTLQNHLRDLFREITKKSNEKLGLARLSKDHIREVDLQHQIKWKSLNDSVEKSKPNPKNFNNQRLKDKKFRYNTFAKSKVRPFIVSDFFPPHQPNSEDVFLEQLYNNCLTQKVPIRILTSDYIASSYVRFDFEPIPQPGVYRYLVPEVRSNQVPFYNIKESSQHNRNIADQLVDQFKPNLIIIWDLKQFSTSFKTKIKSLGIHLLNKEDLFSATDIADINISKSIQKILNRHSEL